MEKKLTYEQAMSRLDEIISILENNKATLDESISLYQEGVELAAYCDSKLKNIEDKVTKIYTSNGLEDYQGDGDHGDNH